MPGLSAEKNDEDYYNFVAANRSRKGLVTANGDEDGVSGSQAAEHLVFPNIERQENRSSRESIRVMKNLTMGSGIVMKEQSERETSLSILNKVRSTTSSYATYQLAN